MRSSSRALSRKGPGPLHRKRSPAGPDRGSQRGKPTSAIAEGGTLHLEHWIYGVSHEKGYGIKAESHTLNEPLHTRYLANQFTPVRMEKTADGGARMDARMIHPAPANDEVLLSLLGRGEPDEYDRPTIQNHTVVIPAAYLRTGQLTFDQVEAAVQEFDRRFTKLSGRIDTVDVQLDPTGATREPMGVGLRRLITKAAVETLATRFLEDPESRTLVLCRESTNQYRNTLLYRLVELLYSGGEIPIFPAISDAPTLSAMNHFRLAISARGVRADRTWTLLDASIQDPALPRFRGKTQMYSRIAEAFAV